MNACASVCLCVSVRGVFLEKVSHTYLHIGALAYKEFRKKRKSEQRVMVAGQKEGDSCQKHHYSMKENNKFF